MSIKLAELYKMFIVTRSCHFYGLCLLFSYSIHYLLRKSCLIIHVRCNFKHWFYTHLLFLCIYFPWSCCSLDFSLISQFLSSFSIVNKLNFCIWYAILHYFQFFLSLCKFSLSQYLSYLLHLHLSSLIWTYVT